MDQQSNRQYLNQSTIHLESHHDNEVNGVVLTSNGQILASSSDDYTVKLWDVQTHEQLNSFQYTGEVYAGLSISPNDNLLAYGGSGDFSIQLRNIVNPRIDQCIAVFKGHEDAILTIVFSQDGQYLYSGGLDFKVIVWDIEENQKIHSFLTPTYIYRIRSTYNKQLISCMCLDGYVRIWNLETKQKIIKVLAHTKGFGLDISNNSTMLATSGFDGLLNIWSLKLHGRSMTKLRSITATDLGKTQKQNKKCIWSVVFAADDQSIISMCNEEGILKIHKISSGELIQQLNYCSIKQNFNGCFFLSQDMNVLVCCQLENQIMVWRRN